MDEPDSPAPADGGLRLDRAQGDAAEPSGDGGPGAGLVALLLCSAALALFLARRVLARKLRGRSLRRGPA